VIRNVWLIAGRELYELFATPSVWIMASLFQVLGGFSFSTYLYFARYADMAVVQHFLASILVIFMPIVTMGRLSQERRQGTMEMLLTSPVKPAELVGGKFVAILTFVGLLVGLSLQYPLLLTAYSNPDPGQWLPGTLGLFLVGMLLGAIGLFASSLTESSVLAGLVSLVISVVLWGAQSLGSLVEGRDGGIFAHLSLMTRCSTFVHGILDSRDIYYFLALTILFLGLAARGVEADRW
jgi:ABC-2 type transport system permease protein